MTFPKSDNLEAAEQESEPMPAQLQSLMPLGKVPVQRNSLTHLNISVKPVTPPDGTKPPLEKFSSNLSQYRFHKEINLYQRMI